MRADLSIFFIFLYHKSTIAYRTCYWPDGSIILDPNNYLPCNLTATDNHSACCDSRDPCTVNGYCFGSAGYVYRGGCTDINWDADECCPNCRFGTESIIHAFRADRGVNFDTVAVAMDTFSNFIPCPRVYGSYTETFCCSAKAGSPAAAAGCCNDEVVNPYIDRGPDRSEASPVSMVSPSQSAQLSSTTTASTKTGNLISSRVPTSTSIPVSHLSKLSIRCSYIFVPTVTAVEKGY